MDAELVIRGGTVIDGTGSAAFAGDVAVAGGRIVGTGRRLSGARELDASGCVVAPGFVDIHTHYDAQVFWDPALTPSPWHGVTTVVAGNCGFSIAPLRAAHREVMIETLQNVEDMIPATLRAGQAVWAQTAVRPIVFDERLDRPFVLNRLPSFARLSGASQAERAVAFGDEGWRAGLRLELESRPMDWGSISVSACGRRPELVGSTVLELAEAGATTPLDAMLDLALADGLGTRFSIPVANADPAEVAPLLQADGVLLGLGDAGAHVGQLCDACFPTELLGTWVRDRGVLTIEAAVHKLTGEPVSFLGLADRGTITEGRAADLCVFDPTTVGPGRLHRVRDLPAGGERVVADSGTGIRHVLVNGRPIRVDGADIDPAARPGSVLRSRPDPDR